MDSEDVEETLNENTLPQFALVELSQLTTLLQRCMFCGSLPRGQSQGKARQIEWKKNGTNLTALFFCSCHDKTRIRWAAQEFIPGTETRTGNIALVSAAQVSNIPYPNLLSLFTSASISGFSKRHFQSISHHYVYRVIRDMYERQQNELYAEIVAKKTPIHITVDGQYDSPGFSAELCAVTAIESTTNMVLDFAIVHKSETGGVSSKMESQGVTKCIAAIEQKLGARPASITIDKHPSVFSLLRRNGYQVLFIFIVLHYFFFVRSTSIHGILCGTYIRN